MKMIDDSARWLYRLRVRRQEPPGMTWAIRGIADNGVFYGEIVRFDPGGGGAASYVEGRLSQHNISDCRVLFYHDRESPHSTGASIAYEAIVNLLEGYLAKYYVQIAQPRAGGESASRNATA